MENIPTFVKTMVGTGVGTTLTGGGIWAAQQFGIPTLWVTAFGVPGIALSVLGASATIIQLKSYWSGEQIHSDIHADWSISLF